ncbi:MAG: GH39 family glycosyl hydrolase [Planctomycetota bacterium]
MRQRPGRLDLTVDTDRKIGTCHRFWTVNVFTSQHQFIEKSFGFLMKRDKPLMKYANCVRLLGGRSDGRNRWYLGVDDRGNVKTDFSGLVKYLRGIIALGYTPRIVLDNVPTEMSSGKEMNKYGNTNPPADYGLWHQYITALVETLVREFGAARVGAWRYRAGTEPDLFPNHWNGTREQYFKHYDVTVDAVTRIIPEADIGPGNILRPGGHKAKWGLDIIDHCARGTNHVSGRPGTRMTYFAISFYGSVGQPLNLEESVRPARERLARYPELRGVPLDIHEFGILHDEHRRRLWGNDITEWGASWYAAVASDVYRLGVGEVYEWCQSTAGLPHPRLQVTRMLEMMADGERLDVRSAGRADGRAGAIACMKEGRLYVFAYNHHPERDHRGRATLAVKIRGTQIARAGEWRMNEWRVDRDHGVWAHEMYRDFERAGLKPLPRSPIYGGQPRRRFGEAWRDVLDRNRAKYAKLAELPRTARGVPVTFDEGALSLDLDMPCHSVRLVELAPAGR